MTRAHVRSVASSALCPDGWPPDVPCGRDAVRRVGDVWTLWMDGGTLVSTHREFRLLLGESSAAPDYDPYGVLPEADQDPVGVRVCETVGELIRDNFLHLLDGGELDTLRRLLEEAAEDYDDLRLPEVPHV